MDKKTTLAFVLIGIILVIWLYFNSPTPEPTVNKKADTTAIAKDTAAKQEKPSTAKVETVKDTAALFGNVEKKEQVVTVETDLVKLELTSKGAQLRRYYLKKYGTWYAHDKDTSDFYNRHVQLINSKNGGDFNILFVTKDGKLVNSSSLDFSSNLTNYYYKISGKDSLVVNYVFTNSENRTIKKSFVVYGNDYASKVDIELENMEDIISSYRYDIVWANGINFVEKNSVDEASHANASAYSGGEQVTVDAASAGEKVTKDINGKVEWTALRDKYFAVIVSPEKPSSDGGAYFEGTHIQYPVGTREFYNVSLKVPFKNQKYQKDSFKLYIGPIDYDILKSYGRNLEALFDFGSFLGLKIIIRPISEYIFLPLLQFLHTFIPNYGFVIIVFSIIIKFLLYPLSRQSMKSMKKMQLLQPKISELKEKLKEDPQKLQKETMKLYSTYGINPMGGCLPMLLQLPIMIALWSLLNVAIDIRQQPFMFWINNLSAPDVIFRLPFKIPFFGIDVVSGLALAMGITMFVQQKMTVQDPSQKSLVYIMPVMMTLMFMGLPSGLNLYYFMFNFIDIGQRWYLNHRKGSEIELVPVANPKQKKGFMARMMEAAEKQAQGQKKAASKRK